MTKNSNVPQEEKLEAKYADVLKIDKALVVSIKRYKEALSDKNIDDETKETLCYSVIKRFELMYELLWQYVRKYVNVLQGVVVHSPHKAFQQCLVFGIISTEEMQQLIDLIEIRNLTNDAYDIDLANKVAADIQKHHDVIAAIIKKVSLDIIKNK